MPTIKEVAKRTGVSISTVSRALANKLYVKESTRQRILAAVAELGYRPNLMAKGLKIGTTMTLALVVPDINNPFYPKLVKSVEQHAARHGYSIILFDANEDKRRERRHFESIVMHSVDGVLLTTSADDVSHISILKSAGIPFVIVHRDLEIDAHRVINDNEEGAHAMVTHLLEHGHRRIACLQGNLGLQRYRQRFAGCVRALREAGIEDFEKYLVVDLDTVEDAYAATMRLLRGGEEPPTAFFAFIDMVAMGVYSAVYELGLRIPGDVSVVGFDNIGMSRHMFPPLTTYENPTDGIAKASVESIVAQIRNPLQQPPDKTVIRGKLIIRESVAALKTAHPDAPVIIA